MHACGPVAHPVLLRRLPLLVLLGMAACARPQQRAPSPGAAGPDADRVRWTSVFDDGIPADSLLTPPGGSRCARGLPDSVVLVGPPRPHVRMDDTLAVRVAGVFCHADGLPARVLVERDGRSYPVPVNILAAGDVQRSVDWIRARRPDGGLEPIAYVRSRRAFHPQGRLSEMDSAAPAGGAPAPTPW